MADNANVLRDAAGQGIGLVGKQLLRPCVRDFFHDALGQFAVAHPDEWLTLTWAWKQNQALRNAIIGVLDAVITVIQTAVRESTKHFGILGNIAEEGTAAIAGEVPDALDDFMREGFLQATYPVGFNPDANAVRTAAGVLASHLRLSVPNLSMSIEKIDLRRWLVTAPERYEAALTALDPASQERMIRFVRSRTAEQTKRMNTVLWAFDTPKEIAQFLRLSSDRVRQWKIDQIYDRARHWRGQLGDYWREAGDLFNEKVRPTLRRQTRALNRASRRLDNGMTGEYRRNPQREFNLSILWPLGLGALVLILVIGVAVISEQQPRTFHGSFVSNWAYADTTKLVEQKVRAARSTKILWFTVIDTTTVTTMVKAPHRGTLPLPDSTFFGK